MNEDTFVDGLAETLGLDTEAVEAGRGIAELDGDAAGLLVGLMRKNADDLTRLEAQVREGVEAERDRWKTRALGAERELAAVRAGFQRLLYPDSRMIQYLTGRGEP